MIRRGWTTAVLLLLGCGTVLAAPFVETFEDYSGLDPDQTSAYWNRFQNRLEIPWVERQQFTWTTGIAPDGHGGYYVATYHGVEGWDASRLQRYDSQGLPLWEPTGFDPGGGTTETEDSAMVVTTSGDVVLIYRVSGSEDAVMAQRLDPSGAPVWPAPVRVNEVTAATYSNYIVAAALSDDGLGVAWKDDRTGSSHIYVQRLNAAGQTIWPADTAVNPTETDYERSLRLGADHLDRLFISWGIYHADNDIEFTRIETDGTVTWDPPLAIPLSTADSQNDHESLVIPGWGLLFSWKEDAQIHFFRRDFDGTPAWGSELLVVDGPDYIGSHRLVSTSGGGLLLLYLEVIDDVQRLRALPLTRDGVATGPTREVLPSLTGEIGNPLAAAPLGTGCIVAGSTWSWMSMPPVFQRVDAQGQPLWPSPRRPMQIPGAPFVVGPQLVERSGQGRGFQLVWGDHRDRWLAVYAQSYSEPTQPTRYGDQQLSPAFPEREATNPAAVQATDGSRGLVWVQELDDEFQLVAGWYESSWSSRWGEPLLLDRVRPDESPSRSYDLTIDALGRGVAVWRISEDGPSEGIWLQAFSPLGQAVHGTAVRVDTGAVLEGYHNVQVEPFSDGSVAVVWVDARDGTSGVYARRIGSNGLPVWPVDQRLDLGTTEGAARVRAAVMEDELHVVWAARLAGSYEVHYAVRRMDQAPLVLETPVSGACDSLRDLAVTPFGSDLMVLWCVVNGSDGVVLGQRISSYVALWADRQLSAGTFSSLTSLSALQTAPDRLAFVFRAFSGDPIGLTLVQEIDGDGNRTYPSEEHILKWVPEVLSHGDAVSARLNPGGDAHWAVLQAEDDPQGGWINYFLSPDGGASWHLVSPDLPVVFPGPGSDLRWGVDMYSEAWQEESPLITRVEVSWNEGALGSDLLLNQSMFRAGDTFQLERRLANPGPPVPAEEYMVLDVAGEYWFWPGWTQAVDNRTQNVPSGVSTESILVFSWPADAGAGSGIRFWSGLVSPGTADLLAPVDFVEFGFE